ncbi:MAG: AraC family transcriptional regulator [Cyanobacteriota bacterium]|nr:AraC family transcriptional regulator [Cyanobacteriota bacterium]
MNFNLLANNSTSENLDSFTDANMLVKITQLLQQSQPPRPILSKTFSFIEENYRNQISLREVAEEVERSPAYLTDLIRRKTGKTVLTWITERRMAEARKLLLETNQSIEQITESVGYFDRRHFSRLFLRFHKSTPHAWRIANQSRNDLFSQTTQEKNTELAPKEAQRLKECVREIAAILYQKPTNNEIFNLNSIEQGSIVQMYDGSVQVILR